MSKDATTITVPSPDDKRGIPQSSHHEIPGRKPRGCFRLFFGVISLLLGLFFLGVLAAYIYDSTLYRPDGLSKYSRNTDFSERLKGSILSDPVPPALLSTLGVLFAWLGARTLRRRGVASNRTKMSREPRNLFSEAAIYRGRTSKLATGTVLGVSSGLPDRLQLTHLSHGIIRVAAIDKSEPSEIPFADMTNIRVSAQPGFDDNLHLEIITRDDVSHRFTFKNPQKAQYAVEALNRLKLDSDAKRCAQGQHSWNGCKCEYCDSVRDEHHNWNGCKCEHCGSVRDEQHVWEGCKCTRCDMVRDEQHDWDLCKGECRRCGATQREQHDWNGCICSRCGATRDKKHDWDGCECLRCGAERHDWKDGKCGRCGRECVVHSWKYRTEQDEIYGEWGTTTNTAIHIKYCGICGESHTEEHHRTASAGCIQKCVCGYQTESHKWAPAKVRNGPGYMNGFRCTVCGKTRINM